MDSIDGTIIASRWRTKLSHAREKLRYWASWHDYLLIQPSSDNWHDQRRMNTHTIIPPDSSNYDWLLLFIPLTVVGWTDQILWRYWDNNNVALEISEKYEDENRYMNNSKNNGSRWQQWKYMIMDKYSGSTSRIIQIVKMWQKSRTEKYERRWNWWRKDWN